MTLDGEISAEHLSVGGRVITRDSGMSVIKTIHTRDVKMQPIRIKAGSLGHTRPDRDMMVAPGARIHIRDWRAEALFRAATATFATAANIASVVIPAASGSTCDEGVALTPTLDRPLLPSKPSVLPSAPVSALNGF